MRAYRCINDSNSIYRQSIAHPEYLKIVHVLNKISSTPWRRMGEWMCRSTCSWPEHCLEVNDQSKSKSHYDQQLVGQSVLVSGAHLGPATNFSMSLRFFEDSYSSLCCSSLSDETTGL
jgi:hypothetical protein